VEAWRTIDPTLQAILKFINPVLAAFSGLFFILAGLLVVNTVYLSMLERVREFGLIMSLGAGGRSVIGMITLESVVLCLTGAAIGAAGGLALVAVLSRGFSIPGMEGLYQTIGLNPVLYPSVTVVQVVSILAFAVVVAILAALWPASLAARIEPTEAMRFTV
jgi:ABC-type antimicrobial peptide transport system permease subunit